MSDQSRRRGLPTSGVFAIMTLLMFVTNEVHIRAAEHEWMPGALSWVLGLMVLIGAVQFFFDLRARRREG
jgi:hypothetical protein